MATSAIVRKDLAEHAWAVLPAGAAVLTLCLALVVQAMIGDSGGGAGDVLSAYRWFVLVGISAWAWLLLDRLVSGEFGAHGWEVMASLPVAPRRVLAAKLAIAVTLVGMATVGGWLVCLSATVSPFVPDVTDEAALGVLLGALAYAALSLGVLLALASCGRLRAWAQAGGAAAVLLLVSSGVEPASLPGLRCVLPGARPPALAASSAGLELGLAAGLVVAALAAVGWRGGRLARRLQGRPAWSGRALTLLLAGALAWPALPWSVAAPAQAKGTWTGAGAAAPFGTGAGVASEQPSSASVAWFPLPTSGGALRVPLGGPAAARAAAARSGELAAALALLPCLGLQARTLTIEHDPALGPRTCEPALESARASLRANLDEGVSGLLGKRGAEAALDRASERRLRVGPWRLLLEGLPGWWIGPGPGAASVTDSGPAPSAQSDQSVASDQSVPSAQSAGEVGSSPELVSKDDLGAAWALDALQRHGLTWGEGVLARWDVVARLAGPEPARALGTWTLVQLTRRAGASAVLRFARAACARRAAPGRGIGTDQPGFAELCLEHLGAVPLDLERELGAEARALLDRAAPALAQRARPETVRLSTDERGHLVFAASARPGRSGRVALLHGRAGWLDDAGGAPPRVVREEVDLGAGPVHTLQAYPSGARVRYAFAVPAPDLGGDLLLGWQEVVIP